MTLLLGIFVLLLIAAAMTLWFFMMPRFSGGADLTMLCRNYAHHGLWDTRLAPSSLEAITLAARVGYGVKLEVVRAKDGRLMIAGKTPAPLSTILTVLDGSAPILLELGGKAPNPRVLQSLARILDTYNGSFAIVSRNPKILAWFKNYRPSYARGQIVSPKSDFATANLLRNYLARPDFLVVEKHLCHRPSVLLLGTIFRLPCFVYRIDSEEDYRACRRQRNFAIFTGIRPKDRPKKGKKNEQFYL